MPTIDLTRLDAHLAEARAIRDWLKTIKLEQPVAQVQVGEAVAQMEQAVDSAAWAKVRIGAAIREQEREDKERTT